MRSCVVVFDIMKFKDRMLGVSELVPFANCRYRVLEHLTNHRYALLSDDYQVFGTDAAKVASRQHKLEGCVLEVCLQKPPQLLENYIKVEGLPELEGQDELALLVEKRTQKTVDKVLYGDDEKVAVVVFDSDIDINQIQSTLARQPFKGHNLKAEAVMASGVVLVRDLPTNVSEEMLRDHFENPRRGGAGEVISVRIDQEQQYAMVTLLDANVAPVVVSRQHTINRRPVKVSLYFECLGPSGGSEEPPFRIPPPLRLSKPVSRKVSAMADISAMNALLSSLNRNHASIKVMTPFEDVQLVCTITKDVQDGRRLLKSWAESANDVLDRHLETVKMDEEATSAAEFAEAQDELRQLADQTINFVYREQEQKIYIVSGAEEHRDVAQDMKLVIHKIRRRLEREKLLRSESMTLSSAEVELLQKNSVEKDILSKFPDLSVNYDVSGEIIPMKGTPDELKEIRQVISGKLKHVSTESHEFPSDLTAQLLASAAVQETVREACLKSDPLGVVRLDAKRLTVWSFDRQKATQMRKAGAETVQKKTIRLDDEHRIARSLPAFEELLTSLQTRQGDLLVIDRSQPSVLGLVSVCPGFHDGVKELENFLEENSLHTESFHMEHLHQELLKYYHEAGRFLIHCKPEDIIYDPDDGSIMVTSTKERLQKTRRELEAFSASVVSQFTEFTEPSFAAYLTSNEGTLKLKEVQTHRKCAIERREGLDADVEQQRSLSLELFGQTSTAGQQPVRREFEQPQLSQAESTAQGATPNTQQMKNFARKPKIFVRGMSDITKEEHDVLVNSSNRRLDLRQGQVSRDLLQVGGDKIEADCRRKYPTGIKQGDIAVTGPGRMREDSEKDGQRRLLCKNIHHCCLPETGDVNTIKKVVKEAVTKCLTRAERDKRTSIGFPALGTGTLKYPVAVMASTMFQAVMEYGCQHPSTCISDVFFILHKKDKDITTVFHQEEKRYKQLLTASLEAERAKTTSYFPPKRQAAEGQVRYPFFEATRGQVVLRMVALNQSDIDGASEDLRAAYRGTITTLPRELPKLGHWSPDYVQQAVMACKAVDVDVTFNFTMERLELRGFRNQVDRVPLHYIIKDAEDEVAEIESAHLTAANVQWTWVNVEDLGMKLVPYDELNNYKIEKAYKDGKGQAVVYDSNRTPFIVDFTRMVEIPERLDPGGGASDTQADEAVAVIRQDKIIEEAQDAPPPDNWGPMPRGTLDVVSLNPDSNEYKKVSGDFTSSVNQPGVMVVKIDRIQNLTLYKQYMSMRRQMKSRFPDGKVFERQPLWHGTKQSTVDSIIKNGFNRSYCDRTNYGQAVYFAKSAEYSSENKYAEKDFSGERHMFYCRVLVGDFTKGNEAMRFLPAKEGDPRSTYDSAVDDVADPQIFIIFKDVQAYPEYHIVFKDD